MPCRSPTLLFICRPIVIVIIQIRTNGALMAKQSYKIIALPGDGIGPEVLGSALRVLNSVRQLFKIDFEVEEIACGGHYYAEHETEWPDGSFEKCEAADAILLGAVGHEIDGRTVFTKPGK